MDPISSLQPGETYAIIDKCIEALTRKLMTQYYLTTMTATGPHTNVPLLLELMLVLELPAPLRYVEPAIVPARTPVLGRVPVPVLTQPRQTYVKPVMKKRVPRHSTKKPNVHRTARRDSSHFQRAQHPSNRYVARS